jgi:hypothetical protein
MRWPRERRWHQLPCCEISSCCMVFQRSPRCC